MVFFPSPFDPWISWLLRCRLHRYTSGLSVSLQPWFSFISLLETSTPSSLKDYREHCVRTHFSKMATVEFLLPYVFPETSYFSIKRQKVIFFPPLKVGGPFRCLGQSKRNSEWFLRLNLKKRTASSWFCFFVCVFYWSTVDLPCCVHFWCTAKPFSIHIYIFFILFSIMVYYRI